MPYFLDRLLGRRDLLIPHFDIDTVLPSEADSPLLQQIFRLRYEVYCLERAFLDPAGYADGIESDGYDPHAAHVAVRDPAGDIVGTVRLVRPVDGQPFPFEAQCRVFDDVVLPARGEAAEVSRLIVEKTFRRRRGDSMAGVSADFAGKGAQAGGHPARQAPEHRGNSPLLLLGMYRELYRYSVANGVRYWYAAMERSLARSLDKMGFSLVPIGPAGDYYGPVTLHMVDLRDLERRVEKGNKFMAAWFKGEPIPTWLVLKILVGGLMRGGPARM